MQYFNPSYECISVFDVCHAYMLLECNYNIGGWLRERPSNQRRRESIGAQLYRIGYNPGHRDVDLWGADDENCSDDSNVRFVYFKKALEWGLPLEADDREAIERIFTERAILEWRPDYFD